MTTLFHSRFLGIAAALYLLLLVQQSRAQDPSSLRYKFQYYDEQDGRVDVESHYLSLDLALPYETRLGLTALTNILTGATPTGLLDPNLPGEVKLQELEDERRAYKIDLTKEFEDHSLTFEYAYSEEDDYISNGYSVRSQHQFFEKNTTLQLGFSFNNDDVTAVPLFGDRGKETYDFAIGFSQLLSPKTILSANFTYGYSRGYLGDPYKSIQRDETFNIPGIPPFTETIPYFENRPGKRTRLIGRLGLLHHIESVRASIDASYRLFQDDAGIRAHTLTFEWNQKIGEKWVLSPYFRFYHQSQADYYNVTLDGTGIEPNDERTGRSPYFSSDYRVSAFDAYTYGIKLVYFPTDSIGIDLGFERYEMHGQDRVTPGAAYARANVFTVGVNYSF